MSIYHAFDEKYSDIIDKLPELYSFGYEYIQISPPQKSRLDLPHDAKPGTPENVWWLRYQPIEHSIGNVYGSREELTELCNIAETHNIKIIADLALNFMGALNGIGKKEWEKAELLARQGNDTLLNSYMDILDKAYPPFTIDDYLPRTNLLANGRSIFLWFGGELPALKTKTQKVRDIHVSYMKDLVACGIKGFRWDAIKFMDPTTLKWYLDLFPEIWSYVETMERFDLNKVRKYSDIADIEDFTWTQWMIDAMEDPRKSVTDLCQADIYIRPHDVTFSLNHDTYHKHLKPWFKDNTLAYLATGFLLAIKNGIPLILNKMADNEIVRAGVRFRKLMKEIDAPESNFPKLEIQGKQRYIIVERGHHGFYVMNINNKPLHIRKIKESKFLSGRKYQNLITNKIITDQTITISPYSAEYFILL